MSSNLIHSYIFRFYDLMAANQERNYPYDRFLNNANQERYRDYHRTKFYFERAFHVRGVAEKTSALYNRL